MANVIGAVVLLAIIGLAAAYVVKAKKSGQKCIGCPDARTCGKNCSGGYGGCSGHCGH